MILAIDTSARSGSIAIVEGGLLKSERTVAHAGLHARWLLKNIDALCVESSVAPGEIDLFAASVGPGSFTGLRIGLTTIKGLAWSLGKPVVGVSTLEALALNAPFSAVPICPILDARKSEVYAALYSMAPASGRVIMEPAAMRPEALIKRLQELCPAPEPIVFMGNGLALYSDFIKKNREGAIITHEPLWHVRASNIAYLAAGKTTVPVPAIKLTPFYLRKSEAEIRKKTT